MSYSDPKYPRLGEQITYLIHNLAAKKSWTREYTMYYISEHCPNRSGFPYSRETVYSWMQGRSCPRSETIQVLTRIGKEDANLPREWGKSLLKAANQPLATHIVDNLWGPRTTRDIPSNLPSPESTELIGRDIEVNRLLELLSPQHSAHLITVDGIGGVGKTSLVLEVAYQCLRVSRGDESDPKVPVFDAIIFVSAKQQYLASAGIRPKYQIQRTLSQMFHEIAQTLKRPEIRHVSPDQDQGALVQEALGRQCTLLIVDNLETMEDKQEIVSFLYDLPPLVKVLMTTRELVELHAPIRLEQLTKEAALNLIEKQAQEKGINVSKENAQILYQCIGGIPAALVYAIGQLVSGYSMETIRSSIADASGDVARFCFEGPIEPLREKPVYHLLLATAMFPKSPLRDAIVHTAGLVSDAITAEKGLVELNKLSLVRPQNGGHYRMLPLTREYALSKLMAQPDFEREARERWIEWYLKSAREHGGRDWKEWHINYDQIEEEWKNLLTVFDWCATRGRYDEMRVFWQGGDGSLNHFSNIYGYWDDELFWTTWLIKEAGRRGDWPTAVEVMVKKGFTFTLMGQLEEADKLLEQARKLHQDASDKVRVNTAQNIARLRIHQGNFDDASNWLKEAQDLLEKARLDDTAYTRRQIINRYTEGKIWYNREKYTEAERCFQDTVRDTQQIGWQRISISAQNYLADIATVEGRFSEAEPLLRKGLVH